MLTAARFREQFVSVLQEIDAGIVLNSPLYNTLALAFIAIVALTFHLGGRLFLHSVLMRWINRSPTDWDNALREHGFFNSLIHLVPALVVFLLTPILLTDDSLL